MAGMKTRYPSGGGSSEWTSILNNPFENSEPSDFLPSDYDFSPFALLAGRSGGQTLNGGTGSGENLQLNSTSHLTKGKTIFGDNVLVINEVNKRVGILTESPNFTLDVNGSVRSNYFYSQNTAYLNAFSAYNGSENTKIFANLGYKIQFFSSTNSTNFIKSIGLSGEEFSGLAAYYLKNGRNTNPDAPTGFDFTIEAGGATVTTTDSNGGNLFLKSGKSTGIGYSTGYLQTPKRQAESGSNSDNSFATILQWDGNDAVTGRLGFFGAEPAPRQELLPYTSISQSEEYTEVSVSELNALRLEVENIRLAYEDLRAKIFATTLIKETI
jgi:hypothetical protein